MLDKNDSIINEGDCVKYWHRADGRPILEIGEVVEIRSIRTRPGKVEAVIQRREYNNTSFSYREKSGITKISKEEATLWKLEH